LSRMYSNRPIPARIEPWQYDLGVQSATEPGATQQADNIARPFDLDMHWRRGGFESSLFAGNDEESEEWLDLRIATDLPLLPAQSGNGIDVDEVTFWQKLAGHNGGAISNLRQKLDWDMQTLTTLISKLEAENLIFQLPFRPELKRSSLYYFCDTGILHRLFGPRWLIDPKEPHNGKSWEGFVIYTVRGLLEGRAKVWAWRRDVDEIDLLLEWSDSNFWALEIGLGARKMPSNGFWRSAKELEVERVLVIHNGPIDQQSVDVENYRSEQLVERFDLKAAILELRASI
jgi:predicted AAA+ superfamily ATPase